MRDLLLRISGLIILTIMAYLLLSVIQQNFTPFEYAVFPIDNSLVPVNGEIGLGVSYILWGQRQLDMIVLAFLLFITAACCTVILGSERSETA